MYQAILKGIVIFIHDHIVVGLLNDGLFEKMQLNPNLVLENSFMVCQSEAVHKQLDIIQFTSHSGKLESEVINSMQDDKSK